MDSKTLRSNFFIFLELRKKQEKKLEISGKIGFFGEKIGKIGDFFRFFSDFFTSVFSLIFLLPIFPS